MAAGATGAFALALVAAGAQNASASTGVTVPIIGVPLPTLPVPLPILGGGGTTPTPTVPGGVPTPGLPPLSSPSSLPGVGGDLSGGITIGDPTTTTTVGAGDSTTTTVGSGDSTTTTTAGSGDSTTTTAPGGSTTSTTAGNGSTTSTTVGAQQTTVHGQSTDTNNCNTTLDPALQPPSQNQVKVTIATDAFPQPHKGDPIKLTHSTLTIEVPASVLQQGVDAGLIKDGDKVPSTVTLVVAGSSTKEQTHTYKVSGTATIHVVNGQAQPLKQTVPLPDTTWTPVNATSNVFFTEKSMTIVSTLTLPGIGTVVATFDCTPSSAPPFVAVAAQGSAIPVAPGGSTTGGASSGGAAAPAGSGAATGASTGSLPFTGGSVMVLLVIAASCVAGGLAVRRSVRLSPLARR